MVTAVMVMTEPIIVVLGTWVVGRVVALLMAGRIMGRLQ